MHFDGIFERRLIYGNSSALENSEAALQHGRRHLPELRNQDVPGTRNLPELRQRIAGSY
jgi:hypothetical protein